MPEKEPVIQYLDGVSFRLAAPFDFAFLHDFGRVFQVYDNQDSGNICFGIDDGNQRLFIKFAGAPTVRYAGETEDAVNRLAQSAKIYQDLQHEFLIRLRGHGPLGGGYIVVFDWFDGICLGKQYPEQRKAFLNLPQSAFLQVFDAIVAFHLHAASKGYVAIDFYDGSILYDIKRSIPCLCDIDFYREMPVINEMGRMWGSARFMSPEEFTLGAQIDEITNVFLMGATAFSLFGGELDRSREKWRLSEQTYQVALKAVSPDRSKRYSSIPAFMQAWKTALQQDK